MGAASSTFIAASKGLLKGALIGTAVGVLAATTVFALSTIPVVAPYLAGVSAFVTSGAVGTALTLNTFSPLTMVIFGTLLTGFSRAVTEGIAAANRAVAQSHFIPLPTREATYAYKVQEHEPVVQMDSSRRFVERLEASREQQAQAPRILH